jgi:hypothetical protein
MPKQEKSMTTKWNLSRLARSGVLLAGLASSAVRAEMAIHPDCKDNRHPVLCTTMVNDLIEELVLVNRTFETVNPLALVEFFHPEAVAYTGATSTFYVGLDSIKNDFLIPAFRGVRTASIDFHLFRFSVISPSVIVTYGKLTATIVLDNGLIIKQPPLPQTVTWVRNDRFDRKKPFLITSKHE